MKKMTYVAAFALAMGLAACGGGQRNTQLNLQKKLQRLQFIP